MVWHQHDGLILHLIVATPHSIPWYPVAHKISSFADSQSGNEEGKTIQYAFQHCWVIMSNPTVDAQPGMRPQWRAGAESLGAPAARFLFGILNESQNWIRSFRMYLLRHYNRSTYSCPWYGYKISPETSINSTKSSWTQGGLNHVQRDCRIVAACSSIRSK